MKQFYTLICLLFVLCCNAQIINFPDANFKAKLLEPDNAFDLGIMNISVDANSDGEIDMSEAANIFALDIPDANISDLTGISNFVNLKVLWCQNNSLTSIAIPHSIGMWDIDASHNQLTSIDVNFVTGEQEFDPRIDLSYNNLTTFSLSNCLVWFGLDLSHNQLTSLNINNCNINYSFYVDNNNLSSINFTGNNSIAGTAIFTHNPFNGLYFYNVSFDFYSTLVFGNNTRDALYFAQEQPGNLYYSSINTSCDFGNFRRVTDCNPDGVAGRIDIIACPNLQNVTLKNGFNHTIVTCEDGDEMVDNVALWMSFSGAPNLSHICVDAGEQSTVQFLVDFAGLQNQITVDSNCPMSSMGVEEIIADKFTVFPVPVTNILNIESMDNIEIKKLEIYNSLGQIVQMEIGNQHNIDVSGLAKGIYYLKIKTDNLTETKKFLKQ